MFLGSPKKLLDLFFDFLETTAYTPHPIPDRNDIIFDFIKSRHFCKKSRKKARKSRKKWRRDKRLKIDVIFKWLIYFKT